MRRSAAGVGLALAAALATSCSPAAPNRAATPPASRASTPAPAQSSGDLITTVIQESAKEADADAKAAITPGVGIGPIRLGMPAPQAQQLLSGAAPACTQVRIGDADIGESDCDYAGQGLAVSYMGAPNSPFDQRNVVDVETSTQLGNAGGRYVTARGVRLGSPDSDVFAAYGQPSSTSDDDGAPTLSYDSLGMLIGLSKDAPRRVVFIRVFKP